MAQEDGRLLRPWMTRTKTTEEQLSAEVVKRGGQASPKYIEDIANELYEPGWRLCEVLESICGIDARALKNRPYKRRSKSAA